MIVLGLMSGTSLDGLDMAYCRFQEDNGRFLFQIIHSETIDYECDIKNKLQSAHLLSGLDLIRLDRHYGHYLGEKIKENIQKTNIRPDIVASHGHTIFHVPSEKMTLQIGHGASIAATCGLPVIFDFRSLDVALGGQGAPLVPIGDQLLFPDFQACVNLGGFSNVSFDDHGKRIAFDICPVNFVTNYLAQRENLSFDENGDIGKSGTIIDTLVQKLQSFSYHQQQPPKSLGREWVEANIFPLLNDTEYSTKDLLRSFYEYISQQIVADIPFSTGNVLFTGGGVKNQFLMQLIRNKAPWKVVVPETQLIDFKEALIFAFMAYLKVNGKNNCLSHVTGADRDSSTGIIVNG